MNAHKSAYEIIMPFGKYKGLSLGHIYDRNKSYLDWLAGAEALPLKWREAAAMVLNGDDISNFIKSPVFTGPPKANIECIDSSTLKVTFEYNKELLERFKFEIDGRKWNDEEKCWEIPSAQILKLVDVFGGTQNMTADDKTKDIWRQEKKRREDLDAIRIKETSNIDVPTKLSLYPYQLVAVEFIDRANGRAMVADQMGLGKTAIAIGYAQLKNYKMLAVVPKSVVPNWAREIKRFAGKNAVIWSGTGRMGRFDAQYHVINYDVVERNLPELQKMGFDLLVCDEATYLKNRRTKRSKALLGYFKERRKYPGLKAKYCLFLTGTPVLNRPVEAFHLLSYLDKNRFNNFYQFTQKYGGWQGSEPRNLDDLHHRTKDLVIRRTLQDVKSELPDKQRNDLYVEMTPEDMKEYNNHLNQLFRRWRQLGKPTVGEMPGIQRFLLTKKIPRAIEMINELLEAGRGIVVFSVYIDPLKQLKKHFKDDAVLVIGEMNSKDRQQSIDVLREGKAKIGLFSLGAGSMGIDGLQYGIDTVLCLDFWWTPAVHIQAEARVHRAGQKNKVQVFYFICENTMDEYMKELLDKKLSMIEQVVDGKLITPGGNKSFFKEFVWKMKYNYAKDMVNFDPDSSIDSEVEIEV